jgi:lipopolysaccharide export system ATP-binding protein
MRTLATDEIGKSYRGRRVVNGVSIRVGQGEVVGLLGPNGAGKTTTFYAIVGLIPPDTGRVLIDEEEITDVPMYLRARQYGISYLPQEASVFRKLTVEENILAVLEAQPISWHERREKMEELIDQLGLEHIRQNRGYALSGGERRRVEIARALCINPTFILLDEPFSGIDPIVHQPHLYFARRTVFRDRPDRRTRSAEDHQRSEGQRNRSVDHRSQRPRDARGHGPGIHY